MRKSPKTTRRAFLGASAATAAALWSRAIHAGVDVDHQDLDPARVAEDPHAFSLGVAAGDVSPSAVRLWTRYDGDDRVRAVVWQHDGDAWKQVIGHDLPRGARGPLHVPVDELVPAQEYRYAFYSLKEGRAHKRSRIGRFKTAPPKDALVPVTLGATCCTMNGRDTSVLEAAGERRDLDALLLLGDSVYADGSHTLADYRLKWWENLERPGYQALRASTSVIATWDDHEVDNDWDPENTHPDKVAAARSAFFEHIPMCRDDECPERIWRKLRFGKTVELFVLDSRGERKRSARPREYLSRAQLDWLKDGLAASDAMFKVIVNSVPIIAFPSMFSTTKQDRWEMFPEQRAEILAFTEAHVPGTLWLSGDFHLATIGRASRVGVGSRSLEVLAGPGAQLGHPLVPWLHGPQFDWASDKNNVTALRFDPQTQRVSFSFHGADGKSFHDATYRKKAVGFEKVEDWLL